MRAFVIALLAAALWALTPLKVAFCARAEEKAGAALGVFPCAGGLALRIARARAQHRRPARESGKKKKRPPVSLLWAIARRLLAHVHVEQLRAQGDLGLDDAAATALATGLLQALLRAVGAAAGARVAFGVRPDFQKRRLRGELAGIASLRVGHIIAAALMGVWEDYRRRKHG